MGRQGREPGAGELGGAAPRGHVLAWLRTPSAWLVAAALAIGAYLFLPLFLADEQSGLSQGQEGFFFEASETAGGPVLVLALWLFYRRSHYLDVLRGPGSPLPAAALLGAALALFAWGLYTGAEDLRLVSLILLLGGTALWLGGRAGLRAYVVPIVFLAFALPLSPVLLSATMFPIQLATAEYAGWLLNAIGVDSYVQGDQILRPENTFVVVETCSGVRTVVTLLMLTVLLIDLFERRGAHAAILLALAPVVALLTNGVRVVTLVLNPHSDVASIHSLQGIAMLLVGLTVMYGIDGLLARVLGSDTPPERDPVDVLAARRGAPRPGSPVRRVGAIAGMLLGMLVLSWTLPRWSYERSLEPLPGALLEETLAPWPTRELPRDFRFRGSTRYLASARRQVRVDGEWVEVFLGVAEEQARTHSIFSPRLGWPGSGYALLEQQRARPAEGALSREEDGVGAAHRRVLRRGARRVISYARVERAGSLVGEWLWHAAALDRSPWARSHHMLGVRISAEVVGGDIEGAERRIARVAERLSPALRGYAPIDGGDPRSGSASTSRSPSGRRGQILSTGTEDSFRSAPVVLAKTSMIPDI